MTLDEVREIIAESQDSKWFEDYTLDIYYPLINFKTSLKGVVSIYEFILAQLNGFTRYEKLPEELLETKDAFETASLRISRLLTPRNLNLSKKQWDQELAIIGQDGNVEYLYDSPEVDFLVKLNQQNVEYATAAYQYFKGKPLIPVNKDYFFAYLLAYEFNAKGNSDLSNRIESEKSSITNVRNDFQKALNEAQSAQANYLARANQKYNEYEEGLDEIFRKADSNYASWFKKTSDDFSGFNSTALKNVKDLENLYREKLKLEAPAQYWKDRAIQLRKEGSRWLWFLIISIIIGIVLLIVALNEISTGTLEKIFDNAGAAIKWSVVFITLISFIAFAIRIFSKLVFSSFHLARDAEEREQLTYVYLALQKEKGIDETERHLIMQSLFSRADTGLLKDDSSPTMPGGIAEKLMK